MTTPEATVEFGELPRSTQGQKTRSSGRHAHVAAQLKTRPGEWAKIATKPTRTAANMLATQIRNKAIVAFRDGDYECSTRGCDVWARYIGPAVSQ